MTFKSLNPPLHQQPTTRPFQPLSFQELFDERPRIVSNLTQPILRNSMIDQLINEVPEDKKDDVWSKASQFKGTVAALDMMIEDLEERVRELERKYVFSGTGCVISMLMGSRREEEAKKFFGVVRKAR
jgi:hypothetical protein